MNFLGNIFPIKWWIWFHPSLWKIRSGTQRFVSGILGGKVLNKDTTSHFSEWLGWSTKKHKTNSWFKEFKWITPTPSWFWEIPKKNLNTKDLIWSIGINQLVATNRKIQKVHLSIPYNTSLFDKNWNGIEILEKWTFVNFDNESPILGILDKKTGKYKAYAKVQSIINNQDSTQNTLDYTDGWYIRAAWLDGVIQRKDTSKEETTQAQTTEKTKKISFSGYVWPDGREIPEYLLKSVTINYFWTTIAQNVNSQIININQVIAKTRESMIKEVKEKNIPIAQTAWYAQQLESLEKRDKWKAIGNAVDAIKINWEKALENPNITQIIRSIQTKPTWQTIVQKAAHIHMQQRKGLIPKHIYH